MKLYARESRDISANADIAAGANQTVITTKMLASDVTCHLSRDIRYLW